MIFPQRLKVRGQLRWLAWVLVSLFAAATVALIYFGVVGDPGSRSPDLDKGGFRIGAMVVGAFTLGLLWMARRTMVTAVVLREDGLFFEEGQEGQGRFVPWGTVARLRIRRIRGEIDLLDLSGEKLGAISTQLEELGLVLHTVATRTRILASPPALPATFRRANDVGPRIILPLFVLGATALGVFIWAKGGGPVGLFLAVMLAAAWVVDYFVLIRAVGVEKRGLTVLKGHRSISTAWDRIEGVALVAVQQPKGQVTIEVAYKLFGGGWRALGRLGQDPIAMLAAVHAAAPEKLVVGPPRLIASGLLSPDLKEAKQGVGGFFQQLG